MLTDPSSNFAQRTYNAARLASTDTIVRLRDRGIEITFNDKEIDSNMLFERIYGRTTRVSDSIRIVNGYSHTEIAEFMPTATVDTPIENGEFWSTLNSLFNQIPLL